MGQHGLINWADDDKDCYELTLNLIEKAPVTLKRMTGEKRLSAGRSIETSAMRRKKLF